MPLFSLFCRPGSPGFAGTNRPSPLSPQYSPHVSPHVPQNPSPLGPNKRRRLWSDEEDKVCTLSETSALVKSDTQNAKPFVMITLCPGKTRSVHQYQCFKSSLIEEASQNMVV